MTDKARSELKNKRIRQNATFGPPRSGQSPHLNACVGHNGSTQNLFDYANHFQQAAKTLIHVVGAEAGLEFASQTEAILLDEAIYPAALCYRHAFETYLKATIELSRAQRGDNTTEVGHHLDKLARGAIEEIEQCSILEATPDEVALIEAVAADCAEIDQTGETFRYPFDRTGKYLLDDWSVINTVQMVERFEEVLSVFERFYNERQDAMDAGKAFTRPKNWNPQK